ncbi:MAG: NAD(P)H-dependent oxidoreductase [Patescibacteria group bacterium]|nr:MAG: NAD(P)H-dependent oxidoreductase [Patescibacteria group bacterium]
MLNVAIILGSTRPNRLSEPIGLWVEAAAKKTEGWNVERVDLRDWPLPFYQEAASVMQLKGEYSIDLAKEWSKKIASFDAYILVTPEYNHGTSAVLKNALDYLYAEWNNKPVAFVGYGSVGGARAVEQLRLVAGELQMADIREAVHVANPWMLVKDGVFAAEEFHGKKLAALIAQLDWWAKALQAAR